MNGNNFARLQQATSDLVRMKEEYSDLQQHVRAGESKDLRSRPGRPQQQTLGNFRENCTMRDCAHHIERTNSTNGRAGAKLSGGIIVGEADSVQQATIATAALGTASRERIGDREEDDSQRKTSVRATVVKAEIERRPTAWLLDTRRW